MTVGDRVAALEALLERVRKNAGSRLEGGRASPASADATPMPDGGPVTPRAEASAIEAHRAASFADADTNGEWDTWTGDEPKQPSPRPSSQRRPALPASTLQDAKADLKTTLPGVGSDLAQALLHMLHPDDPSSSRAEQRSERSSKPAETKHAEPPSRSTSSIAHGSPMARSPLAPPRFGAANKADGAAPAKPTAASTSPAPTTPAQTTAPSGGAGGGVVTSTQRISRGLPPFTPVGAPPRAADATDDAKASAPREGTPPHRAPPHLPPRPLREIAASTAAPAAPVSTRPTAAPTSEPAGSTATEAKTSVTEPKPTASVAVSDPRPPIGSTSAAPPRATPPPDKVPRPKATPVPSLREAAKTLDPGAPQPPLEKATLKSASSDADDPAASPELHEALSKVLLTASSSSEIASTVTSPAPPAVLSTKSEAPAPPRASASPPAPTAGSKVRLPSNRPTLRQAWSPFAAPPSSPPPTPPSAASEPTSPQSSRATPGPTPPQAAASGGGRTPSSRPTAPGGATAESVPLSPAREPSQTPASTAPQERSQTNRKSAARRRLRSRRGRGRVASRAHRDAGLTTGKLVAVAVVAAVLAVVLFTMRGSVSAALRRTRAASTDAATNAAAPPTANAVPGAPTATSPPGPSALASASEASGVASPAGVSPPAPSPTGASASATSSASATPVPRDVRWAAPVASDAPVVSNDRPYLVVASPEVADVYVNGVLLGTTNERLAVTCGWRFVRLAKQAMPAPGQSFPLWIAEGKPIRIACQGVTTASMTADPSPPPAATPTQRRPEPSGRHDAE